METEDRPINLKSKKQDNDRDSEQVESVDGELAHSSGRGHNYASQAARSMVFRYYSFTYIELWDNEALAAAAGAIAQSLAPNQGFKMRTAQAVEVHCRLSDSFERTIDVCILSFCCSDEWKSLTFAKLLLNL